MTNQTSIGELIEMEVRKQRLPIVEFAEMIHCQRNNVYGLFKRNNIDILQLKQISKVLKRNFFQELADDMELVNSVPETGVEANKRIIVSQFLDIVPDVLKQLGKPSIIVFAQLGPEYEGVTGPDFAMPDLGLTFTVGDTLRDRVGPDRYSCIGPNRGSDGCLFEFVTTSAGDRFVNIPTQKYTAEEWTSIFKSLFSMPIFRNFSKL